MLFNEEQRRLKSLLCVSESRTMYDWEEIDVSDPKHIILPSAQDSSRGFVVTLNECQQILSRGFSRHPYTQEQFSNDELRIIVNAAILNSLSVSEHRNFKDCLNHLVYEASELAHARQRIIVSTLSAYAFVAYIFPEWMFWVVLIGNVHTWIRLHQLFST